MLTKTQQEARSIVIKKMATGEYTLRKNPCLCGEKRYVLLATKDRYGVPIRTVLCLGCGLVRSDPYYDERTLADFYSKQYRPLYTGSETATEDFFSQQRTFGRDIVAFLSEKVFDGKEIEGKKVFEVGCGAGGILEAFRERGNEVFGCDYGETYIAYGKQQGLSLVAGGAKTLAQFGIADIIILNHTLEHMTEPLAELEQVKKLLSPSGILYIALPGIYSLHDGYRGRFVKGYLQNAHIWYFTLKTLSAIVERSGFALVTGNEAIVSVFKVGKPSRPQEIENPEKILRYLKKTKNLRWYYGAKKFSLRHSAFETLRRLGPLYRVTRSVYRKFKKIQ